MRQARLAHGFRLVFVTAGGLTLLLSGVLFLATRWYIDRGRILPGVRVSGVDVGGLTPGEARDRLRRLRPVPPGHVRLQGAGQEWSIPVAWLDLPPDLDASVDRARAVGRAGDYTDVPGLVIGLTRGHDVPLALQPGLREYAYETVAQAASALYRPAQAGWYDPDLQEWHQSEVGLEMDRAATLAALDQAVREGRQTIQAVTRAILPDAPDIQGVGPPETGVTQWTPVPTAQEAARAGLVGLTADGVPAAAKWQPIAQFITPVVNADAGRVANIALAVAKLNGALLQPGAVLSFNERVGPREPALGWQQAQEIYNGELVTGYGGGICQVSSTLYNAALLAGIAIVERHHHSRPLSYVPLGQDATVAWGTADLRLRNSGPAAILITARLIRSDPMRVALTLLGQQPVLPARLESVVTRYIPPDYVEIEDQRLPPGARQVTDAGHEGYEVQVFRSPIAAGATRELVARALYRSKAGTVRVGRYGATPLKPGDSPTTGLE